VQPFRVQPVLPVTAYKTYTIASPLLTHFREGTCEEAGCLAHQHGWTTSIDESTELGRRQAHYIRKVSGRSFTEQRIEGLTAFSFPAGQRCFATHKVSLERPEIYLVRGGDWRANPTGERRIHTRAELWVEDFADHQDRIDRAING